MSDNTSTQEATVLRTKTYTVVECSICLGHVNMAKNECDCDRKPTVANDLIVTIDVERGGDWWFECRVCGVNAGHTIREVEREARIHGPADCAEELGAV